jgi:hypothetical protein
MALPTTRRSIRVAIDAEVGVRRAMQRYYPMRLKDLSSHGCSLETVNRLALDEIVWVKFPGLEALEAFVCWEKDFTCGIKFDNPLHPAVMDMLAKQLG